MPKQNSKKNISVRIPKSVLIIAKILEFTSHTLAAKFAIKLFIKPVKFKIPKREQEMDNKSRQENIELPSLQKKIRVYHLGSEPKKALMVHGWSGRGTQLWSIAERLLQNGYSTISFDAPAHGKSTGATSDMTEFIVAIEELDKLYGPFDIIIGHSLGAMAALNAVKKGISTEKVITIGSGDVIQDIINDFIQKLGMDIAISKTMTKLFEMKFDQAVNNYSAYIAAREIAIPVLVIHDEDDEDVPVSAAKHIKRHLQNGELLITKGLGHRKILGDKKVIDKIIQFIKK